MSDHARVHVLCFGNEWQGDDGFGLHVLRQLREEHSLPPHAFAFDAGIAGLNALPLFEGCTKAVLVDAVKTGASVGRLHRLNIQGCAADADQGMHGGGVEQLLAALPHAFAHSARPELVLIAAEIGQITSFTTALSPPVAAVVAEAVRLVMLECTTFPGSAAAQS